MSLFYFVGISNFYFVDILNFYFVDILWEAPVNCQNFLTIYPKDNPVVRIV